MSQTAPRAPDSTGPAGDTGSAEPSGRPARYQRTFAGLIGSMIVLVLVVVAFVAFRALNRDDPHVRPDTVDYLAMARLAQGAGQDVLYPARLPAGWRATRVESGREWSISLLTDDDEFVGVRQTLRSGGDLDELVTTYVDEDATEGETVGVESVVAPRWRTFTDRGGDTAYAAEVGGAWVLVFGSASPGEVREVAATLTDARL